MVLIEDLKISVDLFKRRVVASITHCVCLSVCLSVCPSVCRSVGLSVQKIKKCYYVSFWSKNEVLIKSALQICINKI